MKIQTNFPPNFSLKRKFFWGEEDSKGGYVIKYHSEPLIALGALYLTPKDGKATSYTLGIQIQVMKLALSRGYKRKPKLMKQIKKYLKIPSHLHKEDSINPFMGEILKLALCITADELGAILTSANHQLFDPQTVH